MDRSYDYPDLKIGYYHPDRLEINLKHEIPGTSPQMTAKVILPLNPIGASFIFEEEEYDGAGRHSCTFTGLRSDTASFKLLVTHNFFDHKIYVRLSFVNNTTEMKQTEVEKYVPSSSVRNAFFTKLLEVGRSIRDGTALPASVYHGGSRRKTRRRRSSKKN
jgi:hypothetical protein